MSKQIIRPPQKLLFEEHEKNKLNELSAFGQGKDILPQYRLQTLISLSFYPELENVRIQYKAVKSKRPLSCRPTFLSVFLPANKRSFLIKVSEEAPPEKIPLLVKTLAFNAQVAVLGHELGHVVDYMNKNTFQILWMGISYLVSSFVKELEHKIDLITIKHGLGYQLLQYSRLVERLKEEFPKEKYYKDMHYYYMTPAEIEGAIERLQLYNKD